MAEGKNQNIKNKEGILLVITGPSGVGKDTAKEIFLKRNPDFQKIVTDTNRSPREGEINGMHHNFYTSEQFKQRIKEGKYIEYVEVRPGEYKGGSKEAVSAILAGSNVIWQVDEYAMAHVKGIIKENMPDMADSILERTVTVYIAPEDWSQLREQYFARESQANQGWFLTKLERDKEMWELYKDRFDHIVINRRRMIDETVAELERIVKEKREENQK